MALAIALTNQIFSEWFRLLWRGSRDGFAARAFQERCDDHAGTMTVIADDAGNGFGGFTPIAWESSKGQKWKSLASSANQTHEIPLDKASEKVRSSGKFDTGAVLRRPGKWVSDECDQRRNDTDGFGRTFEHKRAFDSTFRVREIEVFARLNMRHTRVCDGHRSLSRALISYFPLARVSDSPLGCLQGARISKEDAVHEAIDIDLPFLVGVFFWDLPLCFVTTIRFLWFHTASDQ
jgi:hypothetical protein